jgi:hypothetical protein
MSDPTRSALQHSHPLLAYFDADHLCPVLQLVAGPYRELALRVARGPGGPEQTVALRKLLESMDAALRAARGLDVTGPGRRAT